MFRDQTEKAGIARRIQQGLCWYPLRLGRERYNALNQLVIEIERLSDTDVEHAFEYGKPVRFFHTRPDGRIEYLKFNASVSYVNENRMGVVLPSASAIIQLNLFREIGIQLKCSMPYRPSAKRKATAWPNCGKSCWASNPQTG